MERGGKCSHAACGMLTTHLLHMQATEDRRLHSIHSALGSHSLKVVRLNTDHYTNAFGVRVPSPFQRAPGMAPGAAVLTPARAAEWQGRMDALREAITKASEECRPGVWQVKLFFNEWSPGSPITFTKVPSHPAP